MQLHNQSASYSSELKSSSQALRYFLLLELLLYFECFFGGETDDLLMQGFLRGVTSISSSDSSLLLVLLILEAEVHVLLELPKKEQISMLKRENLLVQSGKTGTSLQMCGCPKGLGLYTAL